MNTTKLYQQILRFQPPWSVKSVALKKAEGIIEIEVVRAETLWGCPVCGHRMRRHDKAHWEDIITYFRHHLCNAAAEGLNSRIQQLIRKACVCRTRNRFKRDVFFHFGGLDLHPVITQ